MNAWQTVDFIIENRCSVSRYVDGELNMVFSFEDNDESRKSGFQNFNLSLGKRLKVILQEGGSETYNHKVALPGTMFSVGTDYLLRPVKVFRQMYTIKNLSRTLNILDNLRGYLETNFSRFYLSNRDKSKFREFINNLKGIGTDRDILIVEGCNTCIGVGNDLLEDAKSVKRILCSATNAWSKYDEILETVIQITLSGNVQIISTL